MYRQVLVIVVLRRWSILTTHFRLDVFILAFSLSSHIYFCYYYRVGLN